MAAVSADLILVYGGLSKDGQAFTDGILFNSKQKVAIRTINDQSFGFCCVYNRCILTEYNAIVAAVSTQPHVEIVQFDLANLSVKTLID